MRAKQSAQAGACALVVAILLAGCGGGAVDPTPATSVTALARALPATDTGVPLVAEAAAAPQAAVAWTPTGETVMEWAEATYPQHFPAGPWNRFWSGFTYRQYPQTGNILAYSGQGVYVLGPVSGGQALLVGTLSSFSCQINPTGCSGAFSLAPVAAAPASSVPAQSVLDVTAVLRSPARVDATLYLGDSMTTTFLNGSATGNIASLAGWMPGSIGATLYAASKSYLIKFSQSLALENRPLGVTCTAVCPGFTYSEFHDVTGSRDLVSKMPKAVWMSSAEVARIGVDATLAGEVVCVTGRVNRLLKFVGKHLPDRLGLWLMERRSRDFRKLSD